MTHRVIVVGGGCGGMTAALAAASLGADVLLIVRGPLGIGSNTCLSNGVFNIATDEESFIADAGEAGKGLHRPRYAGLIAGNFTRAFDLLRTSGVRIAATHDVLVARSDPRDLPRGVGLVRDLAAAVNRTACITVVTGCLVTGIIRDGDRACAVRCVTSEGREKIIAGSAVVLAAGGAGAVYQRNDNQATILGHGFRCAALAGCELRDMEFVQFYPMVIDEPSLPSLMLYPPYPDEVALFNNTGEDIRHKHGMETLNDLVRFKRDSFSSLLFNEAKNGPVVADFSAVPEEQWHRYPLPFMERMHYDFRKRRVRISPGAHFFMGGVPVDDTCRTNITGLYACGEVVWGLHGANRRGGNALTECVVSGYIAGQHAAKEKETRSSLRDVVRPVKSVHGGDTDSAAYRVLRAEIREAAWTHAGVERNGPGMREGLQRVNELEERLMALRPGTPVLLKAREDLAAAVMTVKAILTAGLSRCESRGAFIRSDYPETDDIHWKKNSSLTYDEEACRFDVSYVDAG